MNYGQMFDIKVNVNGGGEMGQVGVVCYGIICVLIDYDVMFKLLLLSVGFVMCDVCEVECKKVGLCKVCCVKQFLKC